MHDMSRRSRGAQRRTDDLILFHKPVERATSFKTAQPAKGKLRQQPAKPTSVFHDVPFSHWPISPLLKDNRTNNGPPPQPLTSNTPLLVRCVGVFQKVHTLLYKSLEPPIISVLNVSCRLCGCPALSGITAMLKSDGSKSVSAFLPLLLFCICPVARTHCTAWWDDGTGLGLISLWEWPRRYNHAWSRIQRPKCFLKDLKIKLLLKMT